MWRNSSKQRYHVVFVMMFWLLVVLGSTIVSGLGSSHSSTDVIVLSNCIDAIAILSGVKLKPIIEVSSNGYTVHVYYWCGTTPLRANVTLVNGVRIVHDPWAGLVAFCKSGNKVTRLEALLDKLVKNTSERNTGLGNSIRDVYEALKTSSRMIFLCNDEGVLLVFAPRGKVNEVARLARVFASEVLDKLIARWPAYLNVKRIVVCGLYENPARELSKSVYEEIDHILRSKYNGLGLGLVRYECWWGKKGIWVWEDPLTGRQVLPVMTKYYNEIIEGNKTIARQIGLAVIDTLREVGYPAKEVEIQVWPIGKLVCKPDTSMQTGSVDKQLLEQIHNLVRGNNNKIAGDEGAASTSVVEKTMTSTPSTNHVDDKGSITWSKRSLTELKRTIITSNNITYTKTNTQPNGVSKNTSSINNSYEVRTSQRHWPILTMSLAIAGAILFFAMREGK